MNSETAPQTRYKTTRGAAFGSTGASQGPALTWPHVGVAMDEVKGTEVAFIQPNTHSFVVKVWSVDNTAKLGPVAWRGRITHVPSGHYGHFVNLDEILDFILPYLHQLGVEPRFWWQVRRRLLRLLRRLATLGGPS